MFKHYNYVSRTDMHSHLIKMYDKLGFSLTWLVACVVFFSIQSMLRTSIEMNPATHYLNFTLFIIVLITGLVALIYSIYMEVCIRKFKKMIRDSK